MKLKEITESATTGSGAVATVAQPLGEIQRRIPEQSRSTKYSNGVAPNYAAPRKNKHAR
jgi:hypothetical protein